MSGIKITDIRTIFTAPEGIDPAVVRVEAGLGCATFIQRCKAVKTAMEEYFRPLLIGRDPHYIEDI
ncbi:MAG: hypothetical protein ACOX8S_03795 [Christensenellales bacterium]|jgi:mannonate dehydratase